MALFSDSTSVNLEPLAKDFHPFFGHIETILEAYCSKINSYFSWGILSQKSGEYTINYNLKDINATSCCSSDSSSLFQRFNKENSKNLYYPIRQYEDSISFLCVKDKGRFLFEFNLDNPESFYNNYPLLLGILGDGIEYCKMEWSTYALSIDKSRSETLRASSAIVYAITRNIDGKKETYISGFAFENVSRYLKTHHLPHESFFHSISDFNYEGSSNNGYIDFYREIGKTSDLIRFSDKFNIGRIDPKFLRKILEMTDENNRLLVFKPFGEIIDYFRSEWDVVGLGISDSNPIATAHFMGSSKWQLYSNTELIFYDGKSYTIKMKNASHNETDNPAFEEFYRTLPNGDNSYSKFLDLYKILINQKHGTMLVVSKKAKQEAERLCNANRGIRIDPIDCSTLGKDRILQISKIDGAILIDPDCNCYALGVILDGFVDPSFEGDSGRGARYNSAKLYIHNIKVDMDLNAFNLYTKEYADHAMAVVISEDGYVDVFSSIK